MPKKVESKVCPHCGYCDHCGRGPYRPLPYRPYPYYPQPYWQYPNIIGGGYVTTVGDSMNHQVSTKLENASWSVVN